MLGASAKKDIQFTVNIINNLYIKKMQKVITISTHTNIIGEEQFVETEYPKLDGYLKEGYEIKESIPVIKNHDSSYMYAITFILEKLD